MPFSGFRMPTLHDSTTCNVTNVRCVMMTRVILLQVQPMRSVSHHIEKVCIYRYDTLSIGVPPVVGQESCFDSFCSETQNGIQHLGENGCSEWIFTPEWHQITHVDIMSTLQWWPGSRESDYTWCLVTHLWCTLLTESLSKFILCDLSPLKLSPSSSLPTCQNGLNECTGWQSSGKICQQSEPWSQCYLLK